MVTTDLHLKTQQLADALGVSVSSIKRWIDSGALEATRTMGRHRLVSFTTALEFARREKFPTDGLLAMAVQPQPLAIDDKLCDRLLDALKSGDERGASTLIMSAYYSGGGIVDLADRLIRPIMERIGHGWFLGQWDIYEEHQATGLITSTLAGLNYTLIQAALDPRPLALGASFEGDPYVLPGLLAEIAVREAGWDVRNLGANLPLRSLAAATRKYRPKMIFLSASSIADRTQFINDYAYFYEAANQVGAAVIVGGRALTFDLRSRLVYASFGDRMAHLSEFARRMLPLSSVDQPRP